MITDSSKSAAERRERFQSQKHTQFAKVFLKSHHRRDHLLEEAITRLNRQLNKACAETSRDQRTFIRQRNSQPEPTILVRRPSASKLMQTRSAELKRSDPRYMQPLKSHYQPPSVLETIDAFSVRPRRKVNIWEEFAPKLEPRFCSVVLPSNRLSHIEKKDLKRGYSFHKPRINTPKPSLPLVPSEDVKQPLVDSTGINLPSKRDSFLISRIIEENRPSDSVINYDDFPDEDNDSVFITQKNQIKNDENHVKGEKTIEMAKNNQDVSEFKDTGKMKPIRLINSAPKSKRI